MPPALELAEAESQAAFINYRNSYILNSYMRNYQGNGSGFILNN
jgi:hypothetical protein